PRRPPREAWPRRRGLRRARTRSEPRAERARARAPDASHGEAASDLGAKRAGLAEVHDPQAVVRVAALAPPGAEARGRLADGFVGQLEGAPVHRDESLRAQD